jgi:hypothetical protein
VVNHFLIRIISYCPGFTRNIYVSYVSIFLQTRISVSNLEQGLATLFVSRAILATSFEHAGLLRENEFSTSFSKKNWNVACFAQTKYPF